VSTWQAAIHNELKSVSKALRTSQECNTLCRSRERETEDHLHGIVELELRRLRGGGSSSTLRAASAATAKVSTAHIPPFNQSLPEGNSRHDKGNKGHSSDHGADQSSAAGGAASSGWKVEASMSKAKSGSLQPNYLQEAAAFSSRALPERVVLAAGAVGRGTHEHVTQPRVSKAGTEYASALQLQGR